MGYKDIEIRKSEFVAKPQFFVWIYILIAGDARGILKVFQHLAELFKGNVMVSRTTIVNYIAFWNPYSPCY